MEQFRKSPRARFLDYNGGAYFITICTKDRKHYFGEIYNNDIHLSKIGKFLTLQLNSATDFCKDIEVPLFVVMPNHVHFIVIIDAHDITANCYLDCYEQRTPNPALRIDSLAPRKVPILSRYISSLKGAVSKFAKSHNLAFGWQTRYHDHYIRGHRDGNMIAEYIVNNIGK